MQNGDVKHQIVRDLNFSFNDLEFLTNACFQTKNYLSNFPQVFKEELRDFLFLIKYNNKVASFCSLFPFSFQLNGERISAYCIGSVCTDPKLRKLGLAMKTIQLAEKKAIENAADFIFLFADNNKLYNKLNYISSGKTYLAQISSSLVNKTSLNNYRSLINKCNDIKSENLNLKIITQTNLKELLNIEKSKIWQFIVLNSPFSECILSYLEFCDILKIKNMKMYYITENQEIMGVCFYNKGDDFQNVIHSSYYKDRKYALILIHNIFEENKEKDILFFPGAFFSNFEDIFEYVYIPSMSIKSLNEKKFPINALDNLCSKNSIFVSSLQGT
jgi:predicted N-acetyltransferase YhbS